MFVLINGAFGVGKSTVARELRSLMQRSIIFDPEWVGLALQRIPGRRVSDFQDFASWRRLTVAGARCFGAVRGPVIIPMTFSNSAYLAEVRKGLAQSGRPVLHFCLTAPIEVVRERLTGRGEPPGHPAWSWVHRRAAECCEAHRGSEFGTHIATEHRPPDVVAVQLAALLGWIPATSHREHR
jgi:predicted kinase